MDSVIYIADSGGHTSPIISASIMSGSRISNVSVCLDTGADVSLVPLALADKVGIWKRRPYTGRRIQAANGENIAICSVASFNLHLKNSRDKLSLEQRSLITFFFNPNSKR